MPTTGAAHWHTLLRARAIETQAYVVAAAQCGAHNTKRSSYGHSLVVDPWGEVLADLGGEAEEAMAVVRLDAERIREVRERMPIAAQRRRDVVRVVCSPRRVDVSSL